jgi:CRISPR-associated exonuclease Cas4
MQLIPTHINYYHVCYRKLWLFSHGIRMEHTSEAVKDGKLVHEHSYPQRPAQYTELDLGIAKIDFYDARNRIVHEIKRSNKIEEAHAWQVKYYLYLLKQAGIAGAMAILEYPLLRKTRQLALEQEDEEYLENCLSEIEKLLQDSHPPDRRNKSFCKSCSYFELCWSE